MKMQEFTKGGHAQSRTVRGNIFEVVDVKAAEIMLKDAREGKTRIFWAPRRNFVPVHLDEELTEKVGIPVIVEPRLPGDVAILMPEDFGCEGGGTGRCGMCQYCDPGGQPAPEDPKALWPDEPPLPPAIDERELPETAREAFYGDAKRTKATYAYDLFMVGEGAKARESGLVYKVVGIDARELKLRGEDGPAFWAPFDAYEPIALRGVALEILVKGGPVTVKPGYTVVDGQVLHTRELAPGGATERDGHWTENVLVENPVEGHIHVGVSHADSLTELSFILANAMDARGFNDLANLDPESVEFTNAVSTKLMLAVGELAEAQEELRAGHSYAEVYEKDGKPEGFAVEIADAIYRLLHLTAALGIDIGLVLLEKHEFNLTRPHKHGKKF